MAKLPGPIYGKGQCKMRFIFTVEVEVVRTEGKFESRVVLGSALWDAIEGANPDSLVGDNDGHYEITSWEISEDAPKGRKS
jgi:hypothetical protein